MNSIFILKLQVMTINGNLDTVEKWNVNKGSTLNAYTM
jgi:hypothetical protein